MNRRTQLIVILNLCLVTCLASSSMGGTTRFGFKMGITSTNLVTVEYPVSIYLKDRDLAGTEFALFLEAPILSDVSLRWELAYVQKGWSVELASGHPRYGVEVGEIVYRSRVTYISVPLLVRATVPFVWEGMYLLAGPRVDIWIGHFSDKAAGYPTAEYCVDILHGATLGVGQEFPLGGLGTGLFELNYHHDFSVAYETRMLEAKNKAFALMLGFKF